VFRPPATIHDPLTVVNQNSAAKPSSSDKRFEDVRIFIPADPDWARTLEIPGCFFNSHNGLSESGIMMKAGRREII